MKIPYKQFYQEVDAYFNWYKFITKRNFHFSENSAKRITYNLARKIFRAALKPTIKYIRGKKKNFNLEMYFTSCLTVASKYLDDFEVNSYTDHDRLEVYEIGIVMNSWKVLEKYSMSLENNEIWTLR